MEKDRPRLCELHGLRSWRRAAFAHRLLERNKAQAYVTPGGATRVGLESKHRAPMALRSMWKGRRARPIAPGTEREAVNEPVVLMHNRGELAIEITNLAVEIDALAFECDRLPEAMRRVDLTRTIMPRRRGGGGGGMKRRGA